MPEVSTYDPKKVTVSIGGRVITGFAADGVVTLTHNEDAVTPSVGVKGDVAYSENANNSGNAALPLMSTSSSLAYLREICAKRRPVRFSVSDVNDADALSLIHISLARGAKQQGRKTEYKTLLFNVDDYDEEQGIFSGYGSVFGNVDDGGDIVEPGAFTKDVYKRQAYPGRKG